MALSYTPQPVEDEEPRSPATLPGRTRRGLAAIVALGAAWRFGYVLVAKRHTRLGLNDSLYYSVQASQLAHGVFFRDVLGQVAAAEHGPLAAVVLGPWSRFGDPVLWQRLGNATYGTVTIALVGVLAYRIAGTRASLIAAGIAAASPNFWMNDIVVMSESIALLFVTTALLAVDAAIRRPCWWRHAVAGAAIGLAALARSELVLLALLLAGVLAWAVRVADGWRRLLPGAVLLLACLAVLTPWVVFNLSRFDRPVLLTTNDGTTLVGANCPEMYAGPDIGGWSLFCVFESLKAPVDGDDSVRAARQRREALHYARTHASRLPVVVTARVARSFDLWGHRNLVHADVGEERPAWASWAGVGVWLLTMPLAIAGLFLARQPARALLGAPLLAVVLVSAAYYGAHRIRSSAEPAAAVLAAIALSRLTSTPDRATDPASAPRVA
jgi:hypothetical protein